MLFGELTPESFLDICQLIVLGNPTALKRLRQMVEQRIATLEAAERFKTLSRGPQIGDVSNRLDGLKAKREV